MFTAFCISPVVILAELLPGAPVGMLVVLIVTTPEAADIATPTPATILVTPVLANVTAPLTVVAEMPVPPVTERTPAAALLRHLPATVSYCNI